MNVSCRRHPNWKYWNPESICSHISSFYPLHSSAASLSILSSSLFFRPNIIPNAQTSSCPSPRPPACHWSGSHWMELQYMCDLSAHIPTKTSAHTHWQTRDCPLLPLWTIISEVSAAGPEHSSLRATEISHFSKEMAACGLPLYVFVFGF